MFIFKKGFSKWDYYNPQKPDSRVEMERTIKSLSAEYVRGDLIALNNSLKMIGRNIFSTKGSVRVAVTREADNCAAFLMTSENSEDIFYRYYQYEGVTLYKPVSKCIEVMLREAKEAILESHYFNDCDNAMLISERIISLARQDILPELIEFCESIESFYERKAK